MNYFEHHLGDYAQATAHLTFIEDAAYSRLIRKYYAEERPLTDDLRSIQRLIGARSRQEKIAVSTVLAEFFSLEADGWHNKRADFEIARYREKCDKAKASARIRWDNPQSIGNGKAMRTHSEGNAHHTPYTRHHTPIIKTIEKPDDVSHETWTDFLNHRRAKKAIVSQTAIHGIAKEAAKGKISLETALQEICARGWTGFKAEWLTDKTKLTQHDHIKGAGMAIFGDLEKKRDERIIDINRNLTTTPRDLDS